MSGNDTQVKESIGLDTRVLEQACQWFALIRSNECTEQNLADHKAWMSGNPIHEKEYRDLEIMWECLGAFADRPEVVNECWHISPPTHQQARKGNVGLQQEITQLQQKSNRLQQLSARLQHEAQKELLSTAKVERSHFTYRRRYTFAASLLVLILSSGFLLQGAWIKYTWNRFFNQSIYQTGIGEQRTFYFTDGSSIILDTQTTVLTEFTDDSRRVVLKRGQAGFNVARDYDRPFVVYAGSGAITALGTAFVVRKNKEKTQVTLIEGRVAVAQNNLSNGDKLENYTTKSKNDKLLFEQPIHNEILLEEGQQVSYSKQGLSIARVVDVDKVTAWQEGRLIFEDYSLKEVLDELNRYSDKKIVLGDSALASLRVTGVFKSGDNHKAIQALKAYFSMQVTTDLQGNLVLMQRGASLIVE